MTLLVVERHTTGVVAAELVLRGGTPVFPSEPHELFQVMADSTLHGTATHTEKALYEAMNRRLFELSCSVGDGWLGLRVRAISSSFYEALDAMHDVALYPSFLPDQVAMEQQRHRATAELWSVDSNAIGLSNLYGAIFGRSHPYTQARRDDPAMLAKLTRDDIVRVWKESFDPMQAVLVVAGDVDAESVRNQVEALFSDWKHDPSVLARAPAPTRTPIPARLIVVDRPGAPQATVFFGAPISAIDAPDQATYHIVRALMGGMRSSAVGQRLRDELRAPVSGTTSIRSRSGGGILWWEGSVAREQSATLLAALELQIRVLRDQGPRPEELDAAKAFIVLALPRDLETVTGVANQLAQIAAYHLPIDYLARVGTEINAVSLDAIRAAVPAPSATKAVVVGDLASLRAQLLDLGWGPLEEHDAEGTFVRTIGP